MIDQVPASPHEGRDPPIPIPPLVLAVQHANLHFQIGILVDHLQCLLLIVESAVRKSKRGTFLPQALKLTVQAPVT